MKNAIVLKGGNVDSIAVHIDQNAVAERDSAMQALARVPEVITDTETRDQAIQAVKAAKAHLAAVEEARKTVKSPVLKIGRMIDAAASEHVKNLEKLTVLVQARIGAFEQHLRKIAEEKARKAREELVRAEQEKARLLAEAKRLHAEAAAQTDIAEAAKTMQAALEREMTASELAEQSAKAAAERAELAALKASGGSQRVTYEFDVYDIHALYAFDKECVTLTPNFTRIKILAAYHNWELPGVKVFPKPVFTVKS